MSNHHISLLNLWVIIILVCPFFIFCSPNGSAAWDFPAGALKNRLKYVRKWFRFCRDIRSQSLKILTPRYVTSMMDELTHKRNCYLSVLYGQSAFPILNPRCTISLACLSGAQLGWIVIQIRVDNLVTHSL